MSSRQWRKLSEQLAPRHLVLAPDFLGSGENPPWPEGTPFHFDQDVDAIEASLRARIDEPLHVVGHSYGGLVALMLARRNPQRIRSLSVFDPVAFGVLHGANDADGLADLARGDAIPVFADESRGGTDAWFEVFVDYWNGVGSWRALPEGSRRAFLRVGKKVFYEVQSLLRDRTEASDYAGVNAPTLLFNGERSPVAARRVVEILAAALPHASVRTIEGAGHMGPITHGATVNAAIAEHIEHAEAGR